LSGHVHLDPKLRNYELPGNNSNSPLVVSARKPSVTAVPSPHASGSEGEDEDEGYWSEGAAGVLDGEHGYSTHACQLAATVRSTRIRAAEESTPLPDGEELRQAASKCLSLPPPSPSYSNALSLSLRSSPNPLPVHLRPAIFHLTASSSSVSRPSVPVPPPPKKSRKPPASSLNKDKQISTPSISKFAPLQTREAAREKAASIMDTAESEAKKLPEGAAAAGIWTRAISDLSSLQHFLPARLGPECIVWDQSVGIKLMEVQETHLKEVRVQVAMCALVSGILDGANNEGAVGGESEAGKWLHEIGAEKVLCRAFHLHLHNTAVGRPPWLCSQALPKTL